MFQISRNGYYFFFFIRRVRQDMGHSVSCTHALMILTIFIRPPPLSQLHPSPPPLPFFNCSISNKSSREKPKSEPLKELGNVIHFIIKTFSNRVSPKTFSFNNAIPRSSDFFPGHCSLNTAIFFTLSICVSN